MRVKPRHGEFGIQFHRLRHRGLRLRHLVRRRVERREAGVGLSRAIPRVDGFEAFLDRRIVSTSAPGATLPISICQIPMFGSRGLIFMACSRSDIDCS